MERVVSHLWVHQSWISYFEGSIECFLHTTIVPWAERPVFLHFLNSHYCKYFTACATAVYLLLQVQHELLKIKNCVLVISEAHGALYLGIIHEIITWLIHGEIFGAVFTWQWYKKNGKNLSLSHFWNLFCSLWLDMERFSLLDVGK